MNVAEKINLLEEKPYKLTCMESDYSASFKEKEEAYAAKNRHQAKYPSHEVVITKTVIV
ncbi:hypothetical protein AB9K32_07755 [Allomuricauda sp. XS_ASV26]|uniref:hypothetical protein n=1 Tax=Allomuricauda sp. XS_ASV26 TaxID=3241292 RepID=UPI003516C6E1